MAGDNHVCVFGGGAERSSELRGRRRRPAARDGKLMGLGRVLAPRFRLGRWCPLSVARRRRAPRRIILALAQGAARPGFLPPLRQAGVRWPKIASASIRIRQGPAWITFVPTGAREEEPSPPPAIFFSQIRWRRTMFARSARARRSSELRGRRRRPADRDRHADGPSAVCSLRDFRLGVGALYPLRVGCRAPRRIIWPWLRGAAPVRIAAGRSPPGGSRAPKIASALNLRSDSRPR